MLRVKVGVASSPCAGKAMALYLLSEPLQIGNETMARYYTGVDLPQPEIETRPGAIGHIAGCVLREELGYEEALDSLLQTYSDLGHRTNDLDAVKQRIQDGLDDELTHLQERIDAADWAGWGLQEPAGAFDHAVRSVVLGHSGFDEAADALLQTWIELGHPIDDLYDVESQLTQKLSDAILEAEDRIEIAEQGAVIARIRSDLPDDIADKLSIHQDRPLSVDGIANLLNGLRADGQAIEYKQVQSPMAALTEVFGLDGRSYPTPEHVERVVNGRRIDGEKPVKADGTSFSEGAIDGARKRFLSIYGAKDDLTLDQVELMKQGREVNGRHVDREVYFRKINATKAPVAYIDMVWSPDKSLSVAWGLAKTEAERGILHDIHKTAVDKAMAYVEDVLGFRRKGKEGKDGIEPGKLAWVMFDHYTSRPTAEIEQVDSEGRTYTEFQDVPMAVPDMQLHTHTTLLNAVFSESGKVGAIDLDLLDGKIKEMGGVYQAFVGKGMREHGMDMALDERTGAARLLTIPEPVVKYFSKRSREAEFAAKEFAKEMGANWEDLSSDAKLKLLRKGVESTRKKKIEGGDRSHFEDWQEMAEKVMDYHHETALHTVPARDEHDQNDRRRSAYGQVMAMVSDLFSRRSKVSGQELREIAVRGLIENGIENPKDDIGAVTLAFRERGVLNQEGDMTALIVGKDVPIRGKERWSVTTEFHESTEKEMLALAREARADKSKALPLDLLDRHMTTFLAANPKIDQTSDHWRVQKAAAYAVGTGGKLDGAIGAAGSGKTTILSPLVAAWKEQGRDVYGIALAHTHASALRGAGIDQDKRTALASFMKRVEVGRYKLSEKSVVVIDEFGLISKHDFLDLLRLQKQRGFEIKFVGDPKQCQAVEAGPVMNMLIKAFGEQAFPEIATTVRQKAEREREIAGLFREGEAGAAIAMKREDGTVKLVAGGRDKTISEVAKVWRETTEANAHRPDFTLTVTAPTNADVLDIGAAIRQHARVMGLLGSDERVVKVRGTQDEPELSIPLAVGDKVRLFDRITLPDRTVLGNNSDIVEVVRFTDVGFVARNKDGVEGVVQWEKIRADIPHGQPRSAPEKAWHGGDMPIAYDGAVKLTYGYARTIDSTQGVTSTKNIDAMPDGTAPVQSYKVYVAESRNVEDSIMIINEAAERRQVLSTIPMGDLREIRQDEVWENIYKNLSRQPEKASALEFIANARDLKRGTVMDFQRTMQPLERARQEGRQLNGHGVSRERDEMERGVERSSLMQKVRDIQRDIADQILPGGTERDDQERDANSRA